MKSLRGEIEDMVSVVILSKMMWANEWLERPPICVEFGAAGLFFRSWFGHCHSIASRAAIVRQIFAVVPLIFMLRTSASTLGTSLAGRSSKCARPFSRNRFKNAHACLRGDSRLFTCSHNLCTSAIVARFLLGVSVALQKESVLWRSFEQEFNHFYFW